MSNIGRPEGSGSRGVRGAEEANRGSFLGAVGKSISEAVKFVGQSVKDSVQFFWAGAPDTDLGAREVEAEAARKVETGGRTDRRRGDIAEHAVQVIMYRGEDPEKTKMQLFAELCGSTQSLGNRNSGTGSMILASLALYQQRDEADLRGEIAGLNFEEVMQICRTVGLSENGGKIYGLSIDKGTPFGDRLSALRVLKAVIEGSDVSSSGGEVLSELRGVLEGYDYEGFEGESLNSAREMVDGMLNLLAEGGDSAAGVGWTSDNSDD